MVLCPQSSPPSPASRHPYPSPRSNSPPSITHLKASRNLPILNYPLTDITNFTLAPIASSDECPQSHAYDIYGDAPPRRGRGKNRRGRQRGVRGRDVSGSMPGGAILHSPIPLAATSLRSPFHPAFDFRVARCKSKPPVLSDTPSHTTYHNTSNTHPQPPRRCITSVSAVTSETSSYASKGSTRWTSNSSRGNVIPPSPFSPTPSTRRPPTSHNPIHAVPSNLRQLSPPTSLRFPIPPSSAPPFSRSLTHKEQFSLIPSMNLGSGILQGQGLKKRSRRDLAEVQWQITMHKSLAWRTTRDQSNAERQNVCEHCTRANEYVSPREMDFAQSGLKITFDRPTCTCAHNYVPRTGSRNAQLGWTDSLDQELVKRLWVKLIAQGCRTIPTGISNPPQASTPFPTVENSQSGIPFPSRQPEQPLAPAIELSSTSPPISALQRGIPLRQRVSAIPPFSKSRPPVTPPNTHVSSPKRCHLTLPSMPPSTSFTADSTYPGQMPRVLARNPRGILSPAQLTAQNILRHGDARLKPMKRGRPPGLRQRESSLRHEVTAKHAD